MYTFLMNHWQVLTKKIGIQLHNKFMIILHLIIVVYNIQIFYVDIIKLHRLMLYFMQNFLNFQI